MFLIIDTSSKKSLVVKASERNFTANIFGGEFDHSEKLLLEIYKLMGDKLKNLKGISVVSGPGSYTGLRVGIATANALGYSLNLPIVEINKLEWLAYSGIKLVSSISERKEQKNIGICSIISAIHDMIFAGKYSYNNGLLKQKDEFFSGKIDMLLEEIKSPTFFMVEDVKVLRNIISQNILKNKLGNNFLGIDYLDFYNKKLVKILVDLSLKKLGKEKKYKIIKPLYIQKPNITYSKK